MAQFLERVDYPPPHLNADQIAVLVGLKADPDGRHLGIVAVAGDARLGRGGGISMLKLPSGKKMRMLATKKMIIWKQTFIIGVIIIYWRLEIAAGLRDLTTLSSTSPRLPAPYCNFSKPVSWHIWITSSTFWWARRGRRG